MQNKSVLSAEIDKFGDLDTELAPFKSKISEREKLRKSIVARFETEPADQSCSGEGERFIIKLTARTMKRVYKPGAMKRLAAFIGDTFWKICELPMGKFDDHVTILDRDRYVVEEQTGYRTIEVVARAEAKAA